MKLNLHKHGRKFFFITICTEERRRILSRINEDGSVTLSPIGEVIAEVWRTSHSRNEAVTASNFIIMPDHIHLLLIVNEVLRRLKEEPSARFIKMLPYALPPRYDPSAEDSRELAADRLLILNGFPQTVSANDKIARANCLLMNDLIVTLCENAQTLK